METSLSADLGPVVADAAQTITADLASEKPPAGLLWGLVALIVVCGLAACGLLLYDALQGNTWAREALPAVAAAVLGSISPSPVSALRGKT